MTEFARDYAETDFISVCRDGDLERAQQLIQEGFEDACMNNHFILAKWLLQIKPDIDISAEIFTVVCLNGYLEVAKWLLQVKPTINISADNDCAFRCACHNGHLEVAQWLSQVKPDIDLSWEDDFGFLGLNYGGQTIQKLRVAQWLQSLKPDVYVVDVDEKTGKYKCHIITK
jgi:hypothetical protein